jgi:helicase
LQRDIEALVRAELLDREPSGLLTLTELGRFAGESGLEVRSVVQVSSALRYATSEASIADLVILSQVTVELDAVYLPVHRRSLQEQQRWPATIRKLGASPGLLNALHVGGGEPLARAKRAAACLLYASDLPLANIEAELTQHMRDRSVAGPLRQVAARTRDVIDTVARIVQTRGLAVAPEALGGEISLRLELGLPQQLVELARILGPALTRGEYLSLLRAGLGTPSELERAGKEAVAALIGEEGSRQVFAALTLVPSIPNVG